MTARRPHWDDDLIETVRDGMSTEMVATIGGESVATSAYIPSDNDVFNVIAAVEDWEKPSLDDLQRENLRDLVDAVQRVRDVCNDLVGEPYDITRYMAGQYVLRALDGPE